MTAFRFLGLVLLVAGAIADAHVVLPAGGAAAGSTFSAAFKVGHACRGATVTTALAVHLPDGFKLVRAEPRQGWTLKADARNVTWTADDAKSALPGTSPDSFTVVGKLTNKPGTLWFRALQTCDVGSADWSVVPSAENQKPEYLAPHIDVLAPGIAAIDVRDAWARPTVPGQSTSAVYARLSAPSGGRLVSVTSPFGDVSVHEMHMEGDLMRMRDLPDGLALLAGKSVEFAPNGLHLMLTSLKQQLTVGGAVPLVIHFVDLEGRKGDLSVQVPVTAAPVGADEHHHHG